MLTTAALITLALAGGSQDPASGVQIVKPVDGVRGGKVTVGVDIDNAKSTAARKARPAVVAKVVRTLVDEGAQMPMKVSGYRCTPTVSGPNGVKVAWVCVYRGGEPRTRVELDFHYRLTA
ncbi:MAG TPA: hypothetical protein VFR97_11480 [Capillimicrobium sp.]|nr:hypothetical protein [Capillimicrobium sp.]